MIKKLFRDMLLTQIVSSMTVTLCMLVDSIMIGRFLGVDSMSAYGLASPLLLVFAALGSMISSGVQVMCGKTMGKGDRKGTNVCYTVSAILVAVISAVGITAVLVFIDPVTSLLGAEKGTAVFSLTKDYLTGFILGAPAFLCAQVMVPYMQLAGRRTRLVAAVIAMTLSDVGFDLLNVFVFKKGTLGMGLASTLSYYIAVAIGIGYFVRKSCMFRFTRISKFGKTCRELATYGFPTVVNQISMVLLVFLLNRMLLGLTDVNGTLAVAAYSVISTVGNICYCFGSGIGAVAMMLAAIFFAERDRTSIRELVRSMTRNAVILDIAVTAVGLILARPLIILFLGNAVDAKEIAVVGLRLFLLSIVPSSLNSAFKNYYQGVDRLRLSEIISVLQNFVFTAAFAFVLSRFLGVIGIWLGFVCGEALTLIIMSIIVWRHHGEVSFSADAYSMLEPGFAVSSENCFECEVRTVEEATEASSRICDFCRERGIDKKMSTLIGLCVEEMTVNIIEHGFTKDDLPHNVDVRLVVEGDSRIIRIRDNCVHFDPTKYLELHRTDDPAAHIGLRMVMGTVKEANYFNSLGLNNLTLIL